jgi:hypothetical protein
MSSFDVFHQALKSGSRNTKESVEFLAVENWNFTKKITVNSRFHFDVKILNSFLSWKKSMVDHNPLLPTLISVKEESTIINYVSGDDLGNGRILLNNCSCTLEELLATVRCPDETCLYRSFVVVNDVLWIHGYNNYDRYDNSKNNDVMMR